MIPHCIFEVMNNSNAVVYASDSGAYAVLKKILPEFGKFFLICDKHTAKYCRPVFLQKLDAEAAGEFVFPAGEVSKNLETLSDLYKKLLESKLTRHDVIINLGGGVVTDLGGFAAATFKRGIRFINVPTSLMAMVDAAHGGKTGINIRSVKNQVGSFYFPELVLIDTDYLQTLPFLELKSGFAEMLKHGLITDREYWAHLKVLPAVEIYSYWDNLIRRSVEIKNEIVHRDPRESGERKLLNFGHTAGHAIETLMSRKGHILSHGHAVAEGMIIESMLSGKLTSLPEEECTQIIHVIRLFYKKPELNVDDVRELLELMTYDKKNNGTGINFTLIKSIGSGVIDIKVGNEDITEALNTYLTAP